jgi:hypothetical protein
MSFTLAVVVPAPQSNVAMPAIHRVDGTAWVRHGEGAALLGQRHSPAVMRTAGIIA